jgi:hypothetical protein
MLASLPRGPTQPWTAVTPDAVFTVRTHPTGQLSGPSLVRKFAYEN